MGTCYVSYVSYIESNFRENVWPLLELYLSLRNAEQRSDHYHTTRVVMQSRTLTTSPLAVAIQSKRSDYDPTES